MQLPSAWQLPDVITQRLGARTAGRQRAICEGGHVLLVLHRPPAADDLQRSAVLFWRDAAGNWQHTGGGPGLPGLNNLIAEYEKLTARLELKESKIQSGDSAALFALLDEVVPIHRSARNVHAALQSAREAVQGDRELISVRDLAIDVERRLELLVGDVRDAIDHAALRRAEEQALLSQQDLVTGRRLNILVALLMPLSALTGLFGMNVSAASFGFWAVLLLALMLGLGLRSWAVSSGGSSDRTES